ncbi:MAG: metallophosphoesterase [Nitrospirota bacterium]
MNRRTFLTGMAAAGIVLTSEGFFIPAAEALDVPSFHFAHITDLHLDVDGQSNWQHREKSVPLFIDTLRQIPRLPKLKFVVFGGDQIHYGPRDKESLTAFQQWTAHLNMPYYILLGNTEVSPIQGMSKLKREDYLNIWFGKGLRPGHSSWAFTPVKGVRIIGLDVTVDGKPYGEARPKDLKWLERELKENADKNLIILFTHQLLMPTTERDNDPDWSFWMVRNSAEVRDILKRFKNVRLVISGHHHVASVVTEGRITYVSDPAIITYPCAFRLFHVNKNGIHLKNVYLGDQAVVSQAKELLASDSYAKMYNPADPLKVISYSEGLTPKDREMKIRL